MPPVHHSPSPLALVHCCGSPQLLWFPSVIGGAPSFVVSCPSSFIRCGSIHRRWSPLFIRCPVCSSLVVPPRLFIGGSPLRLFIVVPLIRHAWSPSFFVRAVCRLSPLVRRRWSPLVHSSYSPLFIVRAVRSLWRSPHLFVVGCPLSFVIDGPPSFVHHGSPRSSWFSSFVVCGFPFVHHGGALSVPSGGVMAVSTHNPPRKQWLAGLGTGAGSICHYGSVWGCCCC
jgi:hypothetical protein